MRRRIMIVCGILIVMAAVWFIGPLFAGCQSGFLFRCSLSSSGSDPYDFSGENFTVGRFATWGQPLRTDGPMGIITVDGTLNYENTSRIVVLTRGMGVLRGEGGFAASGLLADDSNQRILQGPVINADGSLLLDGGLSIRFDDLYWTGIDVHEGHLLVTPQVTIDAAGPSPIALHSYFGVIEINQPAQLDAPSIHVRGTSAGDEIVGIYPQVSVLKMTGGYLLVEGPDAIGIWAPGGTVSLEGSRVEAPDGIAIQFSGDNAYLDIGPNSAVTGGAGAVRGSDSAESLRLEAVGAIDGDIDLRGGGDTVTVEVGDSTVIQGDLLLGEGDDHLRLTIAVSIRDRSVMDGLIDGGPGDDVLVIPLGDFVTREDVNLDASEIAIGSSTIRWQNIETVEFTGGEST